MFLERVQQHIHDEVIKLYPDSNPPRVLVAKSEEALQVTNQDVVEALDGLPPIKRHCSVLAEEAIKAAIEDYRVRMTSDE